MARKRLLPPQETYLAAVPEAKPMGGPFGTLPRPAPIAQVASESATEAALREVAGELQAARAEGRLVQRLPLAAVEVDHLVRDRLAVDEAEAETLRSSIRARGQQTPIEVVDLGQGRYGLISGWRRLQALSALHEETGDPRFATVQALLRRPDGASDAYLAMVEENEIRANLGHYERARIAARATEMGVYPSLKKALQHLFQNVSRAKRSKIGSFVTVYQGLDGTLRYPAALPERLGLALAQALEADPMLGLRMRTALSAAAPQSAAAEQALLQRLLTPEKTQKTAGTAQELAPGIWLEPGPGCRLTGPSVDAAFRARLISWLTA